MHERRIRGWLHGHLNLDSEVQLKETVKLDYEINAPRYQFMKINKGDIVRFRRGVHHEFFQGKIVGLSPNPNTYYVEVGGEFTYEVKERYIISVNQVMIALVERK